MATKKAQLEKKVSVKSLVGNVKALIRDGEIKDGDMICRFYGSASVIQGGTGDYGDWVAFKGNFKGVNLMTGEEIATGRLFMPDVASDLLQGAVQGSDGPVEFGFDIGIKFDDEAATGYVYTAESLIEPAEDEVINRLESSFKALEAPNDAKKANGKKAEEKAA